MSNYIKRIKLRKEFCQHKDGDKSTSFYDEKGHCVLAYYDGDQTEIVTERVYSGVHCVYEHRTRRNKDDNEIKEIFEIKEAYSGDNYEIIFNHSNGTSEFNKNFKPLGSND